MEIRIPLMYLNDMLLFTLIKLSPTPAFEKPWDSGVVVGGDFVWWWGF